MKPYDGENSSIETAGEVISRTGDQIILNFTRCSYQLR